MVRRLQVFRDLRDASGGTVALPSGLDFEDPALAARHGEVDVEGILAARPSWRSAHGSSGGGTPGAVAALSLDDSHGGSANKAAAAAEVAASAAAAATPTPEDDEWSYRDPQGEIQVSLFNPGTAPLIQWL